MSRKKISILVLLLIQLYGTGCEKQESSGHGRPFDYVFYVNPSETIQPDTPFFTYTNALDDGNGVDVNRDKRKELPKSIQKTGLLSNLLKNPKISLEKLSHVPEEVSSTPWNPLSLAAFIDNKKCNNLNVKLPSFLPMSVYLAGNHITLESDTKISESLTAGIDIKKIDVFVGLRHQYSHNICPTKVFIKSNMKAKSCLLVESFLSMPEGVLSSDDTQAGQGLTLSDRLELYKSHIYAKQILLEGETHISFYGDVSIASQKKSKISNSLHLSPEDQCFSSDLSTSPNTTIVKLKNVVFAPKLIFYSLNPVENKGYFDVDGHVDLSHTTLKIDLLASKLSEQDLGKKIMIISSTHEIKGTPKVNIEFVYPEANRCYKIDFLKQENKAYLVISKG